MLVNEPIRPSVEEQECHINRLAETFSEYEEFPIQTHNQLVGLSKLWGQKVLYRSLVRTFGRDKVIDGIGSIISEETVRIQVNGLCQEEQQKAS